MTKNIGLDIGSHSIKCVGLKMTPQGPFLTCLGMREIPFGTEKEDIQTLSEILKGLLKEIGLKTKRVNLTISGSGVHIRRIFIPSLPRGELKEAVRWEIKDHLPFPVETAQIDFHILNEYVEENVKKLDVIIVACPKELVDRTLSIAIGAGLQPAHLDIGPFALWNALLAWGQIKNEETVAFIDMGAEKTGVYLFKDRILQFTREVTPAGADITKAIMEGMGSSGGVEILYERAESIKREIGIPLESYQESGNNPSASLPKIVFLIRPVMEKLAAEIERSLEYFKNLFNVEKIDRVLLTGGGAHLKNAASYLANELRLPVEHFNPLKSPHPPLTKRERGGILFDSKRIQVQTLDQMGSSFSIAAGIALPEPKRIELLPAKKPMLSKQQIGHLVPVFAPLMTLVIFLGIIWYMNGQDSVLQKEREKMMVKVQNLDNLQARLKGLKEKDIKLKQELSQFPPSMIPPVPYRDILREVSTLLPENATLTLLSVRHNKKPIKGEFPAEEGRKFHISGLTFGSDLNCLTALALIIERLERSPLFKNVKLASADQNKLYTRPGAAFEIVCDLNLNNPPSLPFHPPTPPLLKGEKEGMTKGGLGGLGEEDRKP